MSNNLLQGILQIDNKVLNQSKVHLALHSEKFPGEMPPYQVIQGNWQQWRSWTEWTKHNWGRNYVISFARVTGDKDKWLFGGIFQILDRNRGGHNPYKCRLIDGHISNHFIGKLFIRYHLRGMQYKPNAENWFPQNPQVEKIKLKSVLDYDPVEEDKK